MPMCIYRHEQAGGPGVLISWQVAAQQVPPTIVGIGFLSQAQHQHCIAHSFQSQACMHPATEPFKTVRGRLAPGMRSMTKHLPSTLGSVTLASSVQQLVQCHSKPKMRSKSCKELISASIPSVDIACLMMYRRIRTESQPFQRLGGSPLHRSRAKQHVAQWRPQVLLQGTYR